MKPTAEMVRFLGFLEYLLQKGPKTETSIQREVRVSTEWNRNWSGSVIKWIGRVHDVRREKAINGEHTLMYVHLPRGFSPPNIDLESRESHNKYGMLLRVLVNDDQVASTLSAGDIITFETVVPESIENFIVGFKFDLNFLRYDSSYGSWSLLNSATNVSKIGHEKERGCAVCLSVATALICAFVAWIWIRFV